MMKSASAKGGKFADSMMMNPRKAMGYSGDTSGGNFGVGPFPCSGAKGGAGERPGSMLSDVQRGIGAPISRGNDLHPAQAHPDHGSMPKDRFRREGKA